MPAWIISQQHCRYSRSQLRNRTCPEHHDGMPAFQRACRAAAPASGAWGSPALQHGWMPVQWRCLTWPGISGHPVAGRRDTFLNAIQREDSI